MKKRNCETVYQYKVFQHAFLIIVFDVVITLAFSFQLQEFRLQPPSDS